MSNDNSQDRDHRRREFRLRAKFIRDIVVTPELAGSTLILHDIDPEALGLALQALLNDPLMRDLDTTEPMLEEMPIANRQYLPQFLTD